MPSTSSKTLRVVIDDLEGARPKAADDALGHNRADALDESGPEVFADSLHGIGHRRFVPVDLELFAKAGVESPGTLHAQHFTGGHGDEIANHADRLSAPGDLYFDDTVAVFFVGKGDPFN